MKPKESTAFAATCKTVGSRVYHFAPLMVRLLLSCVALMCTARHWYVLRTRRWQLLRVMASLRAVFADGGMNPRIMTNESAEVWARSLTEHLRSAVHFGFEGASLGSAVQVPGNADVALAFAPAREHSAVNSDCALPDSCQCSSQQQPRRQ